MGEADSGGLDEEESVALEQGRLEAGGPALEEDLVRSYSQIIHIKNALIFKVYSPHSSIFTLFSGVGLRTVLKTSRRCWQHQAITE